MTKTAVVIPNLNGKESLEKCIDSLLYQSLKTHIIVVENGSLDGSLELLQSKYKDIDLTINKKNLGFAEGVNQGIRRALDLNIEYIALLNNDAFVDEHWLENLVSALDTDSSVGIATCKFVSTDKTFIDSTGDIYTTWGLPYPRGREEKVSSKYDSITLVFGASGGASIYRAKMLDEIGLFDRDFFAYYEDIDISFRAQLAGWKVRYVPNSVAYHQIGAASSKIKGFTAYQATKNLPWIIYKDVPARLIPTILPRFILAYVSFILSAILRGQIIYVFKGLLISLVLVPKKLIQRFQIQRNRKVSVDYIKSIIVYDLPPNATKLRVLRDKWRKLSGRI